jgi:hypothetical protein
VSSGDVADIVISDESAFLNPIEVLTSKPELLLILCSNGTRRDLYSSRTSFAQHVEFVSKPCGPHRLAKALLNCLDKEDALRKVNATRVSLEGSLGSSISTRVSDNTRGSASGNRLIGKLQGSIGFSPTAANLNNIVPTAQSKIQPNLVSRPPLSQRMSSENELPKSKSTTRGSTPLESPSASTNTEMSPGIFNDGNVVSSLVSGIETGVLRPLKMLLVEVSIISRNNEPGADAFKDNPINMMLLATYMKKNKWDYETAENGLVALQAFQNRPQGFDIIFMGEL